MVSVSLSLSQVENDAVRSHTRGDLLANIFRKNISRTESFPRVDVYEKNGDGHFEHSATIVVTSYPPPSASLDELMKNITTEPVGEICICDPGVAFKQGHGRQYRFNCKPGIVWLENVKILIRRRKSPSLTARTTSTIVLKQEAGCVNPPWLFTCAGVTENIQHWPFVRLITPSREPIGKAVSSTVCSQNPEAGLTDDRLWQLLTKEKSTPTT